MEYTLEEILDLLQDSLCKGLTLENYYEIKKYIEVTTKEMNRLSELAFQKGLVINELKKVLKNEMLKLKRQKNVKNPVKSRIAEIKIDTYDFILYEIKRLEDDK